MKRIVPVNPREIQVYIPPSPDDDRNIEPKHECQRYQIMEVSEIQAHISKGTEIESELCVAYSNLNAVFGIKMIWHFETACDS